MLSCFIIQLFILSSDILWSDSFDDGNWTSNPEWFLRTGTANIEGPNNHLFLYGDYNWNAMIGTTADGKHEYNFYMTFKTRIFNNPSSNIEKNWLIVREDTLNSYRVVFYPDTLTNRNPGTIYIQKNDIYVDSALSKNVIKGSKFFVAIQVSNNNIYVACSLAAFTTPPSEWDFTFNEASADTNLISDTLWLGGWDIDTAGRGAMFDDLVVQTPLAGIEEKYVTNPILSLKGYPNPFTIKTTIKYSLIDCCEHDSYDNLELIIYGFLGRIIRTIPIKDNYSEINEVSWDGRDSSGNEVPSGIYFCVLKLGRYSKTLKLTHIR